MTDVGTRLQQARVPGGISLQELSARTKIREALLVAIERGDFARLPRGLLARGFIRAYAREVDLDPESAVRQFTDEFEPASPVPDPTAVSPAERVADEDERRPTDVALESLDLETYSEPDRDAALAVDDADPLTIEIHPTRVVWVQAVADGERVLYA